MRELVPQKLTIEFGGDDITGVVLFYKTNEDGVIGRIKSVSVKNAEFKKTALDSLVAKFISHAKNAEGII